MSRSKTSTFIQRIEPTNILYLVELHHNLSWKSDDLFQRNFLKPNYFPPPPLQGVRFLFLSTQRPQLHKKFRQQRAYDVMKMPLTTTQWKTVESCHILPKNWVVEFLPCFAQGFTETTAQTMKFSWKAAHSFPRNYMKPKIFFPAPHFTGGPDAKILFLSTQRLQLHKKIRAPGPPILEIWGVRGSTFPPLPQNWVGRSLHI